MIKISTKYLIAVIFAYSAVSCISPFEPKGVSDIDNMFVVEGDILLNDTTVVSISNAQALANNNNVTYINNAMVWVENENGTKYYGIMGLKNAHRVYRINTVGLDTSLKYKLCITLSSGKKLESPLQKALISPPIDSVGYNVNADPSSVTFYVNTHDASLKTKYYKWRFDEDWEFHSVYLAMVEYDRTKNSFTELDPITMAGNRYYCWNKDYSKEILVGSSANFTENRIYQKKLTTKWPNDIKISYIYSILVTQQALTKDAYSYWDNMRKNSDDIGGIFAPQPGEVNGNIVCVNYPSEKVIGYISVGYVERKRLITYTGDIGIYQGPSACDVVIVNMDNPANFRDLWDSGYDVVSYEANPLESFWSVKQCVDCRTTGTKTKPGFWPNNHI